MIDITSQIKANIDYDCHISTDFSLYTHCNKTDRQYQASNMANHAVWCSYRRYNRADITGRCVKIDKF